MVNIEKVSLQILDDALYNTLLFEIKEKLSNQNITPQIVKEMLKSSPWLLDEYKEINAQSEQSSIHVKFLQISKDDIPEVAKAKEQINNSVQTLKNLENFERDSKGSAYPIWIGSVGVITIFMAHNIIALFSELYTTHDKGVYLFFASLLGITYLAYIKIKNNHDRQHKIFTTTYTKTQEMINDALQKSYFLYDDIYK